MTGNERMKPNRNDTNGKEETSNTTKQKYNNTVTYIHGIPISHHTIAQNSS